MVYIHLEVFYVFGILLRKAVLIARFYQWKSAKLVPQALTPAFGYLSESGSPHLFKASTSTRVLFQANSSSHFTSKITKSRDKKCLYPKPTPPRLPWQPWSIKASQPQHRPLHLQRVMSPLSLFLSLSGLPPTGPRPRQEALNPMLLLSICKVNALLAPNCNEAHFWPLII